MAEKADIVVNTKVTPSSFAQLKSICKKYGFTVYDLLQMLLDCIIRYMDEYHNLSEDLRRIIRMFEDMPGWKNAFRLTEPMDDVEIMEAFYVLRHPRGKGAPRIVHVVRPVLDGDDLGWLVTCNIQLAFDQFIKVINDSFYRHLSQLSVELGNESILDTIQTIVNLYKENPNDEDMRQMFADNDWHENAKMHDRQQYKRGYSHGMDYMDSQQSLFEDKEEEK